MGRAIDAPWQAAGHRALAAQAHGGSPPARWTPCAWCGSARPRPTRALEFAVVVSVESAEPSPPAAVPLISKGRGGAMSLPDAGGESRPQRSALAVCLQVLPLRRLPCGRRVRLPLRTLPRDSLQASVRVRPAGQTADRPSVTVIRTWHPAGTRRQTTRVERLKPPCPWRLVASKPHLETRTRCVIDSPQRPIGRTWQLDYKRHG